MRQAAVDLAMEHAQQTFLDRYESGMFSRAAVREAVIAFLEALRARGNWLERIVIDAVLRYVRRA